MKYVIAFLKDIWNRPSLYFFAFLIIFSIDRHERLEHHAAERSPFNFDVFEYYRILPDYFINHGETSHAFYKTTFGMAIMYSPAFFAGDQLAKSTGAERNGYSEPYQRTIRWISIIYCIAGLWFCRLSLLRFFSEVVTLATLVTVFFATNLFYYTYGWGQLPHSHLFFLYSAFIYATLRWLLDARRGGLLWLAFLGGFVTLVRPTGVFVFLFPLLFGVNSLPALKTRIGYFFSQGWLAAMSLLLAVLPFMAQMVFWKVRTGHFLYWSYLGERFFFDDPQVINFLFSYRKGWLVYTPVMVFALAGIAVSYRNLKAFFWPVLALLVLYVYLLSSWWEWSYGGSFGCRAMVEFYAFLAFPLAAFISWCWQQGKDAIPFRLLRVAIVLALYFLVKLNLWQTKLFRATIIHWSGMNRETYWYIMRRDTFNAADYEYLQSRFTPPDPEKMRKGERNQ